MSFPRIEMAGKIFGRWVVIGPYRRLHRSWWCKCACGTEKYVARQSLMRGESISCGCAKKLRLEGKIFTRWTVIRELEGQRSKQGNILWLCKCACGAEKEIITSDLTCGHTTSCGCLKIERITNLNKPQEDSNFFSLYRQYQHGASRRNLVFELSDKEFLKLTKSKCTYCGIEPLQIWKASNETYPYTYNGIDRENNEEGYTINNSVSCCTFCNQAKNAFALKDFVKWLDRVANYRINAKPESSAIAQRNEKTI